MKFTAYASGSSGNLYDLTDGQTSIIIECGVSYRQMLKMLPQPPTRYDACLVSHGHQDHCKAVPDLERRGVNVYRGIDIAGVTIRIGSLEVKAFELRHMDVMTGQPIPCYGFIVRSTVDGESLVFATDTYYLPDLFPTAEILALESNFSGDLLPADCPYRDRLWKSHMEIGTLIDALKANDLSKTREIWLLHLSGHHSDADRFRDAIRKVTGKPVYVAGEEN